MKEELRKKYSLIRKNINNRSSKDKIIFQQVINEEKVKAAQTILIYVSYNWEVDTLNLINYFLKNKKVAVPKIENNIMNFYYIENLNELKKGYASIYEPTTNNIVSDFNNCVVITPGLCFNYADYRLGYGKGFYDKFFSQHKVYAIGLCYKECLTNLNFQENNDYPVNKVISD